MISKFSTILCFVIIVLSATSCVDYTGYSTTTSPFSTLTPEKYPLTPTQPTLQVSITANPQQVTRWKEYEYALASKLLFLHPPEEVLCEWEILGEGDQKMYVWAYCLGITPKDKSDLYAPQASIPAVIHFDSNGDIKRIELPRDNWTSYAEGIQNIFPEDIQEIIFSNSINISEMVEHAKLRRLNPSPPLIIELSQP